jgi:hypothetical protein
MLWPRSLLSPVSSASRTIAQNILFHCGTGETPVHHLRLNIHFTKKCDSLFPGLGTDVKQAGLTHSLNI